MMQLINRYVIIRAYSGVFFGKLLEKEGQLATLGECRQVWQWNSEGLKEKVQTCGDIALRGLGRTSKVSAEVTFAQIDEVKATFACTDEAVEIIKSVKW